MSFNLSNLEQIGLMYEIYGSSYVERSFYNPKRDYAESSQQYYIYVQPVLLLFFFAWFVLLVYGLWNKNFFKMYGFMTLYSCTDILVLTIIDIVLVYSFTLRENYMSYLMCYVHKYVVTFLAHVLLTFSQWVRVAQIYQRFIISYKPMTYKHYFNGKIVSVFFVVLGLITCAFAIVAIFLLEFEKVVIIDKQKMETIEIGRYFGYFSESYDNLENKLLFRIYHCIMIVFETILPFIFMLGLTIAFNQVLKKQVAFRARFHISTTRVQRSSERLMKVNIIAGISSVLLNIFQATGLVTYLFLNKLTPLGEIIAEMFGYVYIVIIIVNVPINFFIFSWLSNTFRRTFKGFFKRCTASQ